MKEAAIIGNVGIDPRINTLPNGRVACNFTVAVNGGQYTTADGRVVQDTDWFNVTLWNSPIAQYISRGAMIYVKGFPEVETFTRQDGTFGAAMKITGVFAQLCESRESRLSRQGAQDQRREVTNGVNSNNRQVREVPPEYQSPNVRQNAQSNMQPSQGYAPNRQEREQAGMPTGQGYAAPHQQEAAPLPPTQLMDRDDMPDNLPWD